MVPKETTRGAGILVQRGLSPIRLPFISGEEDVPGEMEGVCLIVCWHRRDKRCLPFVSST